MRNRRGLNADLATRDPAAAEQPGSSCCNTVISKRFIYLHLILVQIENRPFCFVLHNFHLYLSYDNVFSVHKHLMLNSNTQRHRLIYFPFKNL